MRALAEMLSQLGCAEEHLGVDSQLGYPRLYPKLCRHVHATGLPMPFLEGPPQRFLPYSPQAEDVSHLSFTLSFTLSLHHVEAMRQQLKPLT